MLFLGFAGLGGERTVITTASATSGPCSYCCCCYDNDIRTSDVIPLQMDDRRRGSTVKKRPAVGNETQLLFTFDPSRLTPASPAEMVERHGPPHVYVQCDTYVRRNDWTVGNLSYSCNMTVRTSVHHRPLQTQAPIMQARREERRQQEASPRLTQRCESSLTCTERETMGGKSSETYA
jgi:hypothetical protein